MKAKPLVLLHVVFLSFEETPFFRVLGRFAEELYCQRKDSASSTLSPIKTRAEKIMNTGSEYDSWIPSTVPATPQESLSIDLLIQSVDEFQRRDYLKTLDKLTDENHHLQQSILHFQEEWCATLDVVQCVNEVLLRVQSALGKCFQEQIEAEKYWLASWRIEDNVPGNSGYSPAGWV